MQSVKKWVSIPIMGLKMSDDLGINNTVEITKGKTMRVTPLLRWYFPRGHHGGKILQQASEYLDDGSIEWNNIKNVMGGGLDGQSVDKR